MEAHQFDTSEKYKEFADFQEKIRLNERVYAKNNKSEKVHFIFHGGCLNCVTPLHFGIGNCLGCMYYNGVTSGYPILKIEKFLEEYKINENDLSIDIESENKYMHNLIDALIDIYENHTHTNKGWKDGLIEDAHDKGYGYK
jgi:hypothetical protein